MKLGALLDALKQDMPDQERVSEAVQRRFEEICVCVCVSLCVYVCVVCACVCMYIM
jgi:hypothetical protein